MLIPHNIISPPPPTVQRSMYDLLHQPTISAALINPSSTYLSLISVCLRHYIFLRPVEFFPKLNFCCFIHINISLVLCRPSHPLIPCCHLLYNVYRFFCTDMNLHVRIAQTLSISFRLYEFIQAKFLLALGLLVNIEFGRM
jgi:hypothetical protein